MDKYIVRYTTFDNVVREMEWTPDDPRSVDPIIEFVKTGKWNRTPGRYMNVNRTTGVPQYSARNFPYCRNKAQAEFYYKICEPVCKAIGMECVKNNEMWQALWEVAKFRAKTIDTKRVEDMKRLGHDDAIETEGNDYQEGIRWEKSRIDYRRRVAGPYDWGHRDVQANCIAQLVRELDLYRVLFIDKKPDDQKKGPKKEMKRFKANIRGSFDYNAKFSFEKLKDAQKAAKAELILAEPHFCLPFDSFDDEAYHVIDDGLTYNYCEIYYELEKEELADGSTDTLADITGTVTFDGEIVFDAANEEDAKNCILNIGIDSTKRNPVDVAMVIELVPFEKRAISAVWLEEVYCEGTLDDYKLEEVAFPEGAEIPPINSRVVE